MFFFSFGLHMLRGALCDDQGSQSFVHEDIQNLHFLSRICFEATPRTARPLAMASFVPAIMKQTTCRIMM